MLAVRNAEYLGSFPVCGGERAISAQLLLVKDNDSGVPVLIVVASSEVKICDPEDQSLRMYHALRRISFATCESARGLFAFVAREPRVEQHGEPLSEPGPRHYCHAFRTDTPEQAEELNSLVGDAFRMAFASQLQPSAPLWSNEISEEASMVAAEDVSSAVVAKNSSTVVAAEDVSSANVGKTSSTVVAAETTSPVITMEDSSSFMLIGSNVLIPTEETNFLMPDLSQSAELSGGECARAPDSLPGLTHHYRHSTPSKCDIMGMQHETSPTSSEESHSPTEVNCYRRLGQREPLMKRLMGLSGALLQPSDDDSTPLVADTPTTPTNLPLCMNGYVNEASEAEARSRDTRESNWDTREPNRDTRESNRELTPRHDSLQNLEDFTKNNHIKNGSGSTGCSAATSSSSGASSCGGSHGSGNNNVPRAEPELRHAPWFQAGIPREIALEVLSNQPVGAFMVRCSTTQTGCFALSVRVPRDFQPSGIAHYLILRTPKGYKIKGFTKEFTSLSALVTHHSVMPELLPCPLRLARRPAPPRAPPRAAAEPPRAPGHVPFRPQLDV